MVLPGPMILAAILILFDWHTITFDAVPTADSYRVYFQRVSLEYDRWHPMPYDCPATCAAPCRESCEVFLPSPYYRGGIRYIQVVALRDGEVGPR